MEPERPPRRLYTLPEANSALAEVAPLVQRLSELKKALDVTQIALNRISPRERSNGHQAEAIALEHRLEVLVDLLARGLRELEQRGVEVKDLDQGIIDFPSRQFGRVVLLCWRIGEAEIGFWHEEDAGFRGRRPVSELEGG